MASEAVDLVLAGADGKLVVFSQGKFSSVDIEYALSQPANF